MSKHQYYKESLDKHSPEQLYYQIYKILREEIENEIYKADDTMPSENFFTTAFEVSRVTIRKALELLERDGYIKRERGRGTIVLDYKNTFYWSNLTSFTTYLKERKISSIILNFHVEKPSIKVANLLGISPSEEVTVLKRIRLIDNKRIALSTCYLTPHLPIRLTRDMFDENTSLFQLLENAGLQIGTCDETVEAQIPTLEVKKLLKMDRNTAVFYRERVTYDVDDKPFEYTTIVYNADYYKYFIKSRVAQREKVLSQN